MTLLEAARAVLVVFAGRGSAAAKRAALADLSRAAAAVSESNRAAAGQRTRAGLRPRVDAARVRELHLGGASPAEIARHVGCTVNHVHKILRRQP